MAKSASEQQILELKDTILQLNTTIKSLNELIASLQKEKEASNQEVANLKAQLDYMRHKMFGSSSERRNDDISGQLNLFNDEEVPAVVIGPEFIDVTASPSKKTRKPKPTYDEQFANIKERDEVVDTLSDEVLVCPLYGTDMVPIGKELIRTEVLFHRVYLERVNYYATTYKCPSCKETEEPQFIKDNGVPALIPNSYASPSLVANTMYEKFVNSKPLYKQGKDFLNFGVTITRSAMAYWIIYSATNYLKPVCDYLKKLLLKRNYLCADETPIQVLKEPGRRAQAKSYI